jgi:hypothetical protein
VSEQSVTPDTTSNFTSVLQQSDTSTQATVRNLFRLLSATELTDQRQLADEVVRLRTRVDRLEQELRSKRSSNFTGSLHSNQVVGKPSSRSQKRKAASASVSKAKKMARKVRKAATAPTHPPSLNPRSRHDGQLPGIEGYHYKRQDCILAQGIAEGELFCIGRILQLRVSLLS